MKTNVARKTAPKVTAEGGPAVRIDAKAELKRTVLSCLLFEDNFYENGESVAKRIETLVARVSPDFAFSLAVEARVTHNLRHAPLWIAVAMCRAGGDHRRLVGALLPEIIRRADEIPEFLSMYWKDGKVPIAKQVKVGLAEALKKFDEYALAKYNRDAAIKLRDVLFLVHADPNPVHPKLGDRGRSVEAKGTKHRGPVRRHDAGQAALWKRLIDGKLATPDTWEVGISAAKTKEERRAIWIRLMADKKLFALATLRNLRNMLEDGVDINILTRYLLEVDASVVLPFRYIAAAKHNPRLERAIEKKMLQSFDGKQKLGGKTAILIDVSGSMEAALSRKSDMNRLDAACGLAIVGREMFDDVRIFAFSEQVKEIPARHGFSLKDAISGSMQHGGTYLGGALKQLEREGFDRIIVVSDEQTADRVEFPKCKGYMINVATDRNGVGYGKWVHMDGFSEAIMKWIPEYEKMEG